MPPHQRRPFTRFVGQRQAGSIFRPEGPVRRTHWRFTWTSGLTAVSERRLLTLRGLAPVQQGRAASFAVFLRSRQPRQLVPSAVSALLHVLLTSACVAKSVTTVTVGRDVNHAAAACFTTTCGTWR